MNKPEYVKGNVTQIDPTTNKFSLKVEYEGDSQMRFYHDDLKVQVILALLNSMDCENYAENDMQREAEQHADQIMKAVEVAFGRND